MANVELPWITEDTFEELIAKNSMVFMEFWASWCAPCQNFSTIYDRVAALYPEIIFGKVDIEREKSLAETFQIRSVPHLIVFKERIAIYSDSGSMPESTLIELVQQTLSADVSAIIAELDKEGK